MRNKYLVYLLLALLSGCRLSDDKKSGDDGFYGSIAGWDIRHVPIIPPYRATSTYPEQWTILKKDQVRNIQVRAFGVTKNYIYGKIPDDNYKDTGRWFLFNTNSSLYSEYDTELELDATLAKYSLKKNSVRLCEDYFQQLSKGESCYWFPKQGNKYPKYEDAKPNSVIAIDIRENEKGIDFDILGPVKKDTSKIYYFRTLYNKEKNDLYYISLDYSDPKQIRNNDTLAAYLGGDTLTLSVYTPFPVAEKKGIREENRIVITKAVPLKK